MTYTITAGTATQGDDYTATAYTGTLSFGTSDTIKSILIEVQQDEIDEDLETVTVVLSGATGGANIVQSQATLYITDDDLPPSVNVADNSSAEDCSSANCAGEMYLSSLSVNPSSKTVEVDVATLDASATADSDYTAVSQTIQFTPGSTSENFNIAIANDGSSEDNETIIISLTNPINASLDNSTATLVIEDDDPAPQISIADATATEDFANVVLSLNAPAGKNVTVTASTQRLEQH